MNMIMKSLVAMIADVNKVLIDELKQSPRGVKLIELMGNSCASGLLHTHFLECQYLEQ